MNDNLKEKIARAAISGPNMNIVTYYIPVEQEYGRFSLVCFPTAANDAVRPISLYKSPSVAPKTMGG
jgi:hypothetical protein